MPIRGIGRHHTTHEPGGSDALSWGSGGGLDADMLDGHHWSEIPAGGDWQVLAEVEVTSNCDYVDFTGLDINSDWFYVLYFIVKNPTGSNSAYYIFVEGDYTLTNYYRQNLSVNGTSVAGNRANDPPIGYINANDRGLIKVTMVRDPDGYFRVLSELNRDSSSNIRLGFNMIVKTATVTNITQLRVQAAVSGAIGAGSKFILARPRS